MIEAMACGTPVHRLQPRLGPGDHRRRPRPASSSKTKPARSPRSTALSTLDRAAIRKQFEARFTARRMALDYLAAYRSLMEAAEPRIKLVSSAE